ncbi:MAG: hypothetical protein JRG69_01860 [Deltaproteobacteria bacterium]|nr:hypothetical protein [Deltaproteobacteria bacterium]
MTKIQSCPVCGSTPEKEEYSFKGERVHLYACPCDCVVPDELKGTDAEAQEEWTHCVEAEKGQK